LQTALMPMLNKPPSNITASRIAAVCLLVSVADHQPRCRFCKRLSHATVLSSDSKLRTLLPWCLFSVRVSVSVSPSVIGCVLLTSYSLARLANEVKKLSQESTRASVNVRAVPMLCYLSALFCEHGRLDECRQQPGMSQC
jgi:hypothetical protein